MPDPTPTLILHYNAGLGQPYPCGNTSQAGTTQPGEVTCFACRKSPAFKRGQLEEPPVQLSGVMADDEHLSKLAAEAALRGYKNSEGMFTIEEVIHHGDYRSRRTVQVSQITPLTVNCIIMSSAYSYGDWLDHSSPHFKVRHQHVQDLVEDLRHLRVNRSIGWSTFRLVK